MQNFTFSEVFEVNRINCCNDIVFIMKGLGVWRWKKAATFKIYNETYIA